MSSTHLCRYQEIRSAGDVAVSRSPRRARGSSLLAVTQAILQVPVHVGKSRRHSVLQWRRRSGEVVAPFPGRPESAARPGVGPGARTAGWPGCKPCGGGGAFDRRGRWSQNVLVRIGDTPTSQVRVELYAWLPQSSGDATATFKRRHKRCWPAGDYGSFRVWGGQGRKCLVGKVLQVQVF